MALQDLRSLVQELQVHQVELKMQNEELLNTQIQLQASRDSFAELFEFAPIGYLILTSDCIIEKANLTASAMFGLDRSALTQTKLARHVAAEDQNVLHAAFNGLRDSGKKQRLEVRILNRGESVWTQVEASVHKSDPEEWLVTLSDIHLYKQAEDDLRQFNQTLEQRVAERSEQLSQQRQISHVLIEGNVDGVITIDEGGTIESINPAVENTFGYRGDELIGHNVRMLMPAPHRDEHDGYLANYIGTGERKIIGIGREVEGRRKDGSTFPMELAVTEVRLANRRVFIGTVRDITARKEAEHLATSVGQIMEDSLNEIYICSAETMRFVQVNRGARDNIGYTMEELRQFTPIDIEPEFTLESLREMVKPLLSGEENQLVVETLHRRKDGSFYDAEVHVQLTTYQGQSAYVAMAVDISERKRAEYELRLQGQALETGATAIAFGDLHGKLIYVNGAFTRMWGYEEDDQLVGRPIAEFSSSEDDLGEVVRGLREQGQWVGERLARRKDGSNLEVQISASMVTSDSGEPIAMMASFVDISQLKRVEASLARLNEELEQRVDQRNRELQDTQAQLIRKEKLATLGQIAGTVAHEIRNPLAIIKNATYFLDGTETSNQDVRDAFDEINRALNTSNRIVSELLDYARDPRLETSSFPLGEVVGRALAVVVIPESIIVDRDDEPSNVRFLADAGQVERILINLIQNAVHAMPEGGSLKIRGRRVNETTAEIEVIDSGTGIAKTDVAKVFEPLYSTKVKGIGLGLALCKRYAALNQGKLSVESEPDRGSTFRLRLPCVDEA